MEHIQISHRLNTISTAVNSTENTSSTVNDFVEDGNQTTLTSEPEVMTSPAVNFMLLRDILGVDQGSTSMPAVTEEKIMDSDYNHIFAVAQANLVAQTQQDIALQLVEQSQGHLSELGEGSQEPANQSFTKCSNSSPLIADNENKLSNTEKKIACPIQMGRCTSTTKNNENDKNSSASQQNVVTISTKKLMKVEKLKCGIEGCDRSFVYKAHLEYHKLTHSNDRRFHCEVEGCGQSFYTAQRLKVHSRIHNGTRPFVCEECNRGFTTAGNLKNHKRTHSGERPYVCTYEGCQKSFAENSTLHKHLRTHTGEKPFKCAVCDKAFSQSSSRAQHMKKHLIEEKDKWLTESQLSSDASGVIQEPEGSSSQAPKQSELPLDGVALNDSSQTPLSSCQLDFVPGHTTLLTFVHKVDGLSVDNAEKQIIIIQEPGQHVLQVPSNPCSEGIRSEGQVYVIKDLYQQ